MARRKRIAVIEEWKGALSQDEGFREAIGTVSAGAGVLVCSYMTVLCFSSVRPIREIPMLLLGVLLIVLGCQCLGLGLLAELVVRGRPAGDAPRLVARVVTGESPPAGGLGRPGPFSGRGP